ncbi:MAG TPA: hypothetical protein VD969_06250 [Symbiobacteriaceae bacterium]|nr:hypothetical protein [Symbiobacteriaceae bacterium]
MATKLPAIACSTMELAFLAGLLGAESLTGVPDPFEGWSGDDVEAVWAEVRRSLAGRRLLSIMADGSICVEAAVAELVGTCGFAEATFMLTYSSADGITAGHHFHVIRQSAVELVLGYEGEMTCRLTALDTPAVMDRVSSIFRLDGQEAPSVPSGRLTEPDMRLARQLAEAAGREAAEPHLLGLGFCPETAAALAETLARPLGNGALVAVSADQSDFGVDGLALLEGECGMWLLRNVQESGARWVDVVPCTAAALREFIRSIMNRALPGKLL